jgi:hypothetical protein
MQIGRSGAPRNGKRFSNAPAFENAECSCRIPTEIGGTRQKFCVYLYLIKGLDKVSVVC